MDAASTAWLLVCAALVLFMTPGLAFFYGGMDRSRNTLNMLMMSFWCLLIVPIVWALIGYSLAFGGHGSLIGNLDFALLDGTGIEADRGETLVWLVYLGAFATITPALISGAVADRMRFSAWAVFVPLWSVLVYVPVTFWIYGGTDADGGLTGWLATRGSLDFAGGTAIHVNAGVAALAAVMVLGRRRGWPREGHPPHSMPLVMIGTAILFFGWFGFNAGAGGLTDGVAVQAFANTFLAAAAGGLAWSLTERIRDGHFTNLGAASGMVAGLVAITPAAGFVSGTSSIWIGAAAGVICALAVGLKYRAGYDDSLDVVGVHMVGGLVGSSLIGLFARPGALGDFDAGLLNGGGAGLLVEQLIANAVTIVFSFVVTWLILRVIDLTIGLRVDEEDELAGLDVSQHAETAYNIGESMPAR